MPKLQYGLSSFCLFLLFISILFPRVPQAPPLRGCPTCASAATPTASSSLSPSHPIIPNRRIWTEPNPRCPHALLRRAAFLGSPWQRQHCSNCWRPRAERGPQAAPVEMNSFCTKTAVPPKNICARAGLSPWFVLMVDGAFKQQDIVRCAPMASSQNTCYDAPINKGPF